MRVCAYGPQPASIFKRLLTGLLLCSVLTGVLQARAPRKKRQRRPVIVTLSFTPSPEIDQRVREEVDVASMAMDELTPQTLLENPFVVQAMYFHDGFLQQFAAERPTADPTLRISAQLCQRLTPQLKLRFMQMLRSTYTDVLAYLPDSPFLAPVPNTETPRRGRRYTHTDAVDLFVPEGTPVVSAARGVVVLAESGWTEGDPFSTSSTKGGNTVIVYDPARDRFYRYAHLATVSVKAGSVVLSGDPIGTVGHTGANASRPGHGRHLHFEINQFDGMVVRSLSSSELRDFLRDVQPSMSVGLSSSGQ